MGTVASKARNQGWVGLGSEMPSFLGMGWQGDRGLQDNEVGQTRSILGQGGLQMVSKDGGVDERLCAVEGYDQEID